MLFEIEGEATPFVAVSLSCGFAGFFESRFESHLYRLDHSPAVTIRACLSRHTAGPSKGTIRSLPPWPALRRLLFRIPPREVKFSS
jgi:hypothetical protein